jgi:nitrite reductase/ring-hydroxylating ferredoxin subunit/uncharacterized membrane protein
MRRPPSSRPANAAERAIGAIERSTLADRAGRAIGKVVALPLQAFGGRAQRVRNAAHGTHLGHPLHPALTALPVGMWTLALALDLLDAVDGDRRDYRSGADLAWRAGTIAGVGAALTGVVDWQHTHGRDRRTGLVHGLVNAAGLALAGWSLRLRRQGRRGDGRLAAAAGWGLTAVGGYLGGHLVYRRGLGVDRAERSPVPRDFEPVLPMGALVENKPRRVELWDEDGRRAVGVVLVRHRGRVYALGSKCAHMGGPLEGGWVLNGGLTCPWHGSRFDLRTGRPLDGPATCPQPRYDVRIRAGMVEVRRDLAPGEAADEPGSAPASPPADARAAEVPPAARKADVVLYEHHELIRGLFRRIRELPREDPRRRDLVRALADELELHEHIEDTIFYPAVRPVSRDVPVAHAEHRQLADLLAVVLGLNTATETFDEHLRALHEAVDHHATSEEVSMFEDAQRLGDRQLRLLGRQLETQLEELRTSRFHRTWRTLKQSVMARAPSV